MKGTKTQYQVPSSLHDAIDRFEVVSINAVELDLCDDTYDDIAREVVGSHSCSVHGATDPTGQSTVYLPRRCCVTKKYGDLGQNFFPSQQPQGEISSRVDTRVPIRQTLSNQTSFDRLDRTIQRLHGQGKKEIRLVVTQVVDVSLLLPPPPPLQHEGIVPITNHRRSRLNPGRTQSGSFYHSGNGLRISRLPPATGTCTSSDTMAHTDYSISTR